MVARANNGARDYRKQSQRFQTTVFKIYTRTQNSPAMSPTCGSRASWSMPSRIESSRATIVLPNGFDRSDNWSFWKWSFPAVCVSQDWEQDFNQQNYHTSHDYPKLLIFILREVA